MRKRLLLLLFTALIILALSSFALVRTPIGRFNVSNVAPFAPYNWAPNQTHDKSQTFTWTEGLDPNGDAVSTYLCITNDTDVDSCSVVNTFTANPTYTFTQAESNWDYLWGTAVRNYYVKLTPNDGSLNGTVNDTISFTLYDYIPSISAASSTGYADGLVDEDENLTFYVDGFSDTDAVDNHSMWACKTNSITTSGTCGSGEYCNKSSYTADTNQTCTLNATDTAIPNNYNTAYLFICDCPPNDNSCPGQCSASASVPFYVNHKPQVNGTPDIKPDSPNSTNDLNCSYIFYDKDGDSEGTTTFKWYRDYNFSGVTTQILGAGNTSPSEIWQCEVTPQDEHGLYGTPTNSSTETIESRAPTFTVVTDDNSSYSDPTVYGDNVTFTANATDPDSQNYTLYVCYTNNITGAACEGGQTVCSSPSTASGAQASCQHSTSGEMQSNYTWYSFVCDTDNNCSAMENSNSPYYVNHRPNATNVDIKPDSPNTNHNLTCNYTFADLDGDGDSSTFKWHNWSGVQWNLVGVTTKVLPNTYTTVSETWMCEVTPVDDRGLQGIAINSTNETITNAAPNQPSNFSVQDSASTWDNIAPYDGHDNTPLINWTAIDDDGDTVNTTICVSSTNTNRNNGVCDVYQTSTTNQYATLSGLNYSGTSVDYYLRLIPNDGIVNGTYLDVNYSLLNSQPNTPYSLSPNLTHVQKPNLTWVADDPDNGSVDHWPADTLTYYLRVGTSYGDGSYENNNNADNSGEQVDNDIPWGTPGTEWANNTVYVRIWSTDGYLNSSNYDATLVLYDYLPDITNVEMTDTGAYSSCTTSTCALNPVEHSNTTAAVRVTTIDTDDDCDGADENGEIWIHLCLNTSSCSPSTGNYYWEVDSVVRSGSNCTYTFSSNKTASDGTPEFYIAPNSSYRFYVNSTDQAGARTTDGQREGTWTYNVLSAIDYPSMVYLGDGSTDLNQWNNGTSLAVMTNWGNNILDLKWNTSDPTSGTDTWVLNGTDMELDDDSSHNDENSGFIAPIYIDATQRFFDPDTGLERCTSFDCNDTAINETLDTYYHIYPPYGLQAGEYNSTITIELLTHS